jgi:predicted metal-dependent hydrolase
MHQIMIDDIVVDVIRKKIKNLHLSILPPLGQVRLSVPLRVNDETLQSFIKTKLTWIRKGKAKFAAQKKFLAKEYVSGETHYYQGQAYDLNLIYQKGISQIILRDDWIMDFIISENSDHETRRDFMDNWYRQELKRILPALILKWQAVIGVQIADCRIKKMKTRWGSCNTRARRIWLNLELIKKPKLCLEYVLVHEMVHLLEHSHNHRFAAFMNQFMPDWRVHKAALNQFGLDHGKS